MHSDECKVLAIILAAGYSHRFGHADKRLAKLPDGRPMLAATVATATSAFPLIRVVLRQEDDRCALGLPEEVPIVYANQLECGLGASLSSAIKACMADTSLDHIQAVAILLGDMPNIRTDTMRHIEQYGDANCIVRPFYQGNPGHPVLFGRRFWQELATLKGDESAKAIMHRHPLHCRQINVSDPGVCQDVDTPEMLEQLTKH